MRILAIPVLAAIKAFIILVHRDKGRCPPLPHFHPTDVFERPTILAKISVNKIGEPEGGSQFLGCFCGRWLIPAGGKIVPE